MPGATTNTRILVVEDEGIVARTLDIIFSNEGYDTRSVESAEAALEIVESEGWVPHLAILDVHLPGMNGIDFAILLKAVHPEVRLTLYSGRAETAELIDAYKGKGYEFDLLAKPVHPTIFLAMAASIRGETGPAVDIVH